MVTEYHKNVTNGIYEAGKEFLRLKKIKKVHTGDQKPLSIVDSHTKLVVNYKPDVHFKLNNNKKMIFEVLDSESNKQDIIIADVIRSFLVEDVDAVIFVYYQPEKKESKQNGKNKETRNVEKRILEALVTISKGLIGKGINQDEIPFEKSGTLKIDKKNGVDREWVKKRIMDEYFCTPKKTKVKEKKTP